MTIRLFLRYAACALLVSLSGCMTYLSPDNNNTPPPGQKDDEEKNEAEAAPPAGSAKDVANKADVGKKIFQGLSDGIGGVEKAINGKLPGDMKGSMGAAGNTLKVMQVGANAVDAYGKDGVKGAAGSLAVDGCKHVASSYVTPVVTAAATTVLIGLGAGPVTVGVGAAAAGLGARWVVGKVVDAAVPHVKAAANHIATGIGETLADGGMDHVEGMANGTPTLRDYETEARIRQAQEDRAAEAQYWADYRARYKANAAFNEAINNASRNANTPRGVTIPACSSHGGK